MQTIKCGRNLIDDSSMKTDEAILANTFIGIYLLLVKTYSLRNNPFFLWQ